MWPLQRSQTFSSLNVENRYGAVSRLNRVLSQAARTGMREKDTYVQIFSGVEAPPGNLQQFPIRMGERALECPICRTVSDRFLPFGLDRRPNAQCPNCGSLERHRMFWLFLTNRTNILRRPCKLLHTSPEPCLESRLLACLANGYVTTDCYNPRVDVAADLKALPFADGAFDVVLSSHVLEHIENDSPAIKELGRVLRTGGKAIIMVPYDPKNPTYCDPGLSSPAERMFAYGHPFHYRIYGHDLLGRLAAVGLAPRAWSTKELFSPAQRRRYRLNNNYLLACEKR